MSSPVSSTSPSPTSFPLNLDLITYYRHHSIPTSFFYSSSITISFIIISIFISFLGCYTALMMMIPVLGKEMKPLTRRKKDGMGNGTVGFGVSTRENGMGVRGAGSYGGDEDDGEGHEDGDGEESGDSGCYGCWQEWGKLAGAGGVMGFVGIWSMHFIALHSFTLKPTHDVDWYVEFSPGFTILSLLFIPLISLCFLILAFFKPGNELGFKNGRRILTTGSFLITPIIIGCLISLMRVISSLSTSFDVSYRRIQLGVGILLDCLVGAIVMMGIRYYSQWQTSLWKRFLYSLILAISFSGIQYFVLVDGTKWMVKGNGKIGKETRVVLVIVLSIISIFLCLLIITLSHFNLSLLQLFHIIAFRFKNSNRQQRTVGKVVVASAAFDSSGRLLVREDGNLPMMVIESRSKVEDLLYALHYRKSTFQWIYALSFNWTILNPFLGKIQSFSLNLGLGSFPVVVPSSTPTSTTATARAKETEKEKSSPPLFPLRFGNGYANRDSHFNSKLRPTPIDLSNLAIGKGESTGGERGRGKAFSLRLSSPNNSPLTALPTTPEGFFSPPSPRTMSQTTNTDMEGSTLAELVFKQRFIESTQSLANELMVPLASMGVLYDRIFITGTRTVVVGSNNNGDDLDGDEEKSINNEEDIERQQRFGFRSQRWNHNRSNDTIHKLEAHPPNNIIYNNNGQEGVMMLLVRNISEKGNDRAEKYEEMGYKLVETKSLTSSFADRVAVEKDEAGRLLENLRGFARRGMRPVVQPEGVYVGLFGVRNSVKGLDTLVYDFARHQIPAYRLPDVKRINDEIREWVSAMMGKTMCQVSTECERPLPPFTGDYDIATQTEIESACFKASLSVAIEALVAALLCVYPNLSKMARMSPEILEVPSSMDDSTKPAIIVLFEAILPPPLQEAGPDGDIKHTPFMFTPYSLFAKAQTMMMRNKESRDFAKAVQLQLSPRYAETTPPYSRERSNLSPISHGASPISAGTISPRRAKSHVPHPYIHTRGVPQGGKQSTNDNPVIVEDEATSQISTISPSSSFLSRLPGLPCSQEYDASSHRSDTQISPPAPPPSLSSSLVHPSLVLSGRRISASMTIPSDSDPPPFSHLSPIPHPIVNEFGSKVPSQALTNPAISEDADVDLPQVHTSDTASDSTSVKTTTLGGNLSQNPSITGTTSHRNSWNGFHPSSSANSIFHRSQAARLFSGRRPGTGGSRKSSKSESSAPVAALEISKPLIILSSSVQARMRSDGWVERCMSELEHSPDGEALLGVSW